MDGEMDLPQLPCVFKGDKVLRGLLRGSELQFLCNLIMSACLFNNTEPYNLFSCSSASTNVDVDISFTGKDKMLVVVPTFRDPSNTSITIRGPLKIMWQSTFSYKIHKEGCK
jgi:hypothetical protein